MPHSIKILIFAILNNLTMGKGDIKTKRGKIINGSFGVSRPHKEKKTAVEVVESKPKKTAKK